MRESLRRTVELPDEDATATLGREIAAVLMREPAAWLVLLQGELGSGKSTLARAVVRTLGHEGAVPSPTYTLIEPYELDRCKVYHIDLYRISDPEELEFLGWSDLNDGIRLIEWPERVPNLVDQGDILISLEYDGNGRTAALTALSDAGKMLLDRLDTRASSVRS